MLGWGREDNVPRGVAEPLYARAMFVEGRDDGRALAYVCADLGMIAAGLRVAVLDRLAEDHSDLGLDAASVVLTATHTHSGPSGFSHALFYDLAGPGFSKRVFDDLVGGIVLSILDAHRRLVPASLELGV
ncbi:MAG: neutral/alkaline non-lysosomal ceramidase N-terminal domain-containing protein, partial [Deltaproteobacteria bacterium]|nr:neutral/alkaline non-lysosomal ceramidase N-terminal domain-containing protein [Deltaproteobacteria bacterium]